MTPTFSEFTMKFDAARKKEYYEILENLIAEQFPNYNWKWEKGYKTSFMTIATIISDQLDEHEDYDYVYDVVKSYIESTFKDWLSWDDSGFYNLIGYLNKKDRIYLFIGKRIQQSNSTHNIVEGLY